MNGKIGNTGWLYIERAGKMKMCSCPFSTPDESGPLSCGDWCPLFREPTVTQKMIGMDNLGVPIWADGDGATIGICKTILEFKVFTDDRVR